MAFQFFLTHPAAYKQIAAEENDQSEQQENSNRSQKRF